MTRTAYTAERAYRVSVVPLAVLLILNGAAALLVSMAASGESITMPFLNSAVAKRLGIAAVGLLLIVIGVGLIRLSRIAWYGLFVCIILGTALFVVAPMLYGTLPLPDQPWARVLVLAFSVLINAVIVVGLYFATRPAFAPSDGEDSESERG